MSEEPDNLLDPSEAEAPLVALIKQSPSSMTDSELSELTSNLRSIRTNAQTRRAKTKAPTKRAKANPLPFNPNDLLS